MKMKFFIVISLFLSTAAFASLYEVDRYTRQLEPDLTLIPSQIGEWQLVREEKGITDSESKFLNDVLFRTYGRPDGKTLSLAIAYGGDQRQYFSIHAPEGCYIAAGYDVTSLGVVQMEHPALELKEMVVKGPSNRMEPVQFWIVLDGKIVTNHFERKIKQIYYSLIGTKSDGILVRVSSEATDNSFHKDFHLQRQFIAALYRQLNPDLRSVLFGNPTDAKI